MAVIPALGAIATCIGLGIVLGRVPLLAAAVGDAVYAIEPPAVPAAVGLTGVAVLGMAVWGGPVGHPAVAALAFLLVVLGEEIAVGRVAGIDRVVAAGLVAASCVLPFLRYGADSFADLRSAADVLGPPLLAGPGTRMAQCAVGALVGLAAAAWLSSDHPTRADAATVAARPRLLIPGAAALLLVAAYFGPAIHGSLPRLGVWAIGALVVGALVVVVGRFLRRFADLWLPALAGALLLAGAGGGLAA